MKKLYKSILFVTMLTIVTMFNWSCDKNDNSNGGVPYISYIRVTNPVSADSLLVAAGQGQLIAIVGGNLQNTQQVWFNDLLSVPSATYVTNTTVLVHVPNLVPRVVNNKIKLVFAGGDSLLYDFTVTINKPSIASMDCEYVLDGDSATIHGGYFYLPISVTFPSTEGSLKDGIVVSSEDPEKNLTVNSANNIINVKVPAGAQPGQLIISTNFGKTASDFWFRDNRNIIEGFDGSNDPGTNGTIISNSGAGDPPNINGKYCRVINPAIGSWAWTQVFARWGAPYCAIPDAAILHPNDYNYKFELCTTKPYDTNGVRVWITDPAALVSGPFYNWWPPINTYGEWQTITIPLSDIMAKNAPIGIMPNGYFCAFVYCEGGTLNCDMSYDNFRIVPKTITTVLDNN